MLLVHILYMSCIINQRYLKSWLSRLNRSVLAAMKQMVGHNQQWLDRKKKMGKAGPRQWNWTNPESNTQVQLQTGFARASC